MRSGDRAPRGKLLDNSGQRFDSAARTKLHSAAANQSDVLRTIRTVRSRCICQAQLHRLATPRRAATRK